MTIRKQRGQVAIDYTKPSLITARTTDKELEQFIQAGMAILGTKGLPYDEARIREDYRKRRAEIVARAVAQTVPQVRRAPTPQAPIPVNNKPRVTKRFIDETMRRYDNRHACHDPSCAEGIERVSRDLAAIVRYFTDRRAEVEADDPG